MTDHHRSRRRLAAIAVALLAMFGAGVPLALWWLASPSTASFADSEVLEANHLGAASLDIIVGSDTAVLVASNLAPGDVVSGQIELTNVGTLPLRYGVTARTGGGLLRDWLSFALWQGQELCQPDTPTTPLVSDVKLTSVDTVLISAASGTFVLAPDQSTLLCLGASLPLAAPNEVQGQRLDLELIVFAEHDLEADA